jgi:hypothetical protein
MKKKRKSRLSPGTIGTKERSAPPVKARPREFAALALLGLWVVYGTLTPAHRIWSGLGVSRQRHAAITAHLGLFAQLRPDIAGEAAVGYVSASGGGADYYLARFALNPILVLDDLRHTRRVIAFFPDGIPRTLVADQGLTPVKSYGNGLFLMEKRASP